MHLCNLARCQHSKGIVFINFEGEISWMTIPFFLVDANMQASQNYGTTTGTAARVLRPSTEYQWSPLALPTCSSCSQDLHHHHNQEHFFLDQPVHFSGPPQSVSLLTNARSGPRRAGSAKCTSCANKFRKHTQAITISIATRKWSISSPSYSREWLQNVQLLQQKMRKDQVDFLVFSSFAIASLPVVHIQVEKIQRPCEWTPTLWSTPHLCTNLSLARSRLAFSSQWNVLEWFVELRTWVIKHTKLVCIDVIWFAKKSLKIKASCHADCIGKMQKWRNTMMGWQKLNKYA